MRHRQGRVQERRPRTGARDEARPGEGRAPRAWTAERAGEAIEVGLGLLGPQHGRRHCCGGPVGCLPMLRMERGRLLRSRPLSELAYRTVMLEFPLLWYPSVARIM